MVGLFGDRIKIRVKEVAEKGKANKRLIGFLSEKLDLPKSSIKITSGSGSALKTLKIQNPYGKGIKDLLLS